MNGFDQSAAEEFMKYQTLVDVANETLTGTGKGYKMTFKNFSYLQLRLLDYQYFG